MIRKTKKNAQKTQKKISDVEVLIPKLALKNPKTKFTRVKSSLHGLN